MRVVTSGMSQTAESRNSTEKWKMLMASLDGWERVVQMPSDLNCFPIPGLVSGHSIEENCFSITKIDLSQNKKIEGDFQNLKVRPFISKVSRQTVAP